MNALERILTVLGLGLGTIAAGVGRVLGLVYLYLIERARELRRRGSRRSSDLARMLTLDRERNRRS